MTSESDPLLHLMLGKDYRVLEQIGVGGMAVVYLVEHQKLLKQFAAKVLSTQHAASAEARARFTQEAHAASQLDHENIVTISDFGITPDQRPYFVMELLRGKTLSDRLDEGPMTLEEVVAVTLPVARALAYAHAEGIIHRDVKPENIFLVQRTQGRWTVKVLDFGIAKVPANDRMTKVGQALGSPMFMAPEACRGEDVDQRADIYSFGIVLYLMLAGRVPFTDENMLKVLQMQVSAPVPPPTTFNPELPPELEAVVMRALAKDPDDRYESMEDMLYDLEAALPDGSDVMLLQAQFGTSHTPFPGTLERVRRNSDRMKRATLSPLGVTGRYNVPVTGEYAGVTGKHTPQPGEYAGATGKHAPLPNDAAATARPTAPQKRGRGMLALVLLLLIAGGGAGGFYIWKQSQQSTQTVAAAAPTPPVAVEPPAVNAAPAQAEPPVATAPEQPTTAVDVATETPAPADPPTAVDDKPAPNNRPVRAKTVATSKKAGPKVVAVAPPPPRAGSAAQPPRAGSAAQPAGSASAAGSASPAGSAAPPTSPAVTTMPTKPIETPAPAPAPPPPPVASPPPVVVAPKPVQAPPPVVNVGSMDATPSIASLDVNGPLQPSLVRRAVERVMPALRACYRTAATAQKKTSAITLSINFEVDESSTATNVSTRGASFGSLSSCAKSAVGRIQTQHAPDVGTAQVALAIKFTPL